MITVKRRYNDFSVKISKPGTGWRGYSVVARSVQEVNLATEHYFDGKHNGMFPDCPLCRKMRENERPRKRRTKQQIMLDALAEM